MTTTEPDHRIGPWGPRTLDEDAEADIRLGPLTLHLARTAGEIRLAHTRDREEREERQGDAEEPDRELEWSRWAGSDWTGEIGLHPTFPDRPVVVAPEEPFHLVAGADARIYVRVPLWVKVEATGRGRTTKLTALPTIPTSDTWWGTVEEGELCFSLTTHARRAISEELFEPHLAMCPIELVNRSDEDLTVDKIALRVDYLSLYTRGGQIWADETRVRYQGDVEGSRLEMAGRPPAEASDARLLAAARLKMARGFKARTFARLRSMQGWVS